MATFNTNNATPSVTAAQMVTQIMLALSKSPAAVLSIVVDGQTVEYSRAQAIEELMFWQRQAAKEAGTRPRTSRIRLDRSW